MSSNPITKIPFLKSMEFSKNLSLFVGNNFHNGSFYQLSFPFYNIFVVTDPEILKHVLIDNEPNYWKSEIYWGELRRIVGDALGTLQGDDWLWMKRLQQPFFTHAKTREYLPELLRINEIYIQKWKEKYKNQDGKSLIHLFSELNLAVVLKVVFGIDRVEASAEIAKFIADGEETIAYRSKFPWRPYTAWLTGHNIRVVKYLNFFDKFTKEEVDRKLKHRQALDMLDKLIEESHFNNGKLDLQDIRNEIIIHLGASTETAAVALGWTLYLLNLHPEYQAEVREEISNVVGDRPLQLEDYPKLIKTKWAIQEAMRLFPPSHGISRDAKAEDVVKGVTVPKGATMFISAYGLHRSPEIWDKPTEYIPHRFANEKNFVKYSYIPFGAGKHTCIGRYLGMPLMVFNLANFIKNFEYEVLVKDIYPLSLSTLKPNQPLKFRLKF